MNFIICDDQMEHALYIKNLIQKQYSDADILCTSSEIETIDYIKQFGADVVIMDIVFEDDLGNKSEKGIKIAKRIQEISHDICIIFVSGHVEDYFEEVYEVEHIFFLQKPIRNDKFKIALNKATEYNNNNKKNYILISEKGSTISINQKSILYLESKGRTLQIVMNDGRQYTTYEKLNDVLERITNKLIIRCHQSYAFNLQHFKSIDNNEIKSRQGSKILVSRKYLQEVKNSISQYLGGI